MKLAWKARLVVTGCGLYCGRAYLRLSVGICAYTTGELKTHTGEFSMVQKVVRLVENVRKPSIQEDEPKVIRSFWRAHSWPRAKKPLALAEEPLSQKHAHFSTWINSKPSPSSPPLSISSWMGKMLGETG